MELQAQNILQKLLLAKEKPDGLVIIRTGDEKDFMRSLQLKEIWDIGKKSRQKLINANLDTVEKILNTSKEHLQFLLGEAAGDFLFRVVRADCTDIFNKPTKNHSLSTECTFDSDIVQIKILLDILFSMSAEIMSEMLKKNLHSKTAFVKIRYGDFTTTTMQSTGELINDTSDLYEHVKNLFLQKRIPSRGIRLLGIGVSEWKSEYELSQLSLFKNEKDGKMCTLEKTIQTPFKNKKEPPITRTRLLK